MAKRCFAGIWSSPQRCASAQHHLGLLSRKRKKFKWQSAALPPRGGASAQRCAQHKWQSAFARGLEQPRSGASTQRRLGLSRNKINPKYCFARGCGQPRSGASAQHHLGYYNKRKFSFLLLRIGFLPPENLCAPLKFSSKRSIIRYSFLVKNPLGRSHCSCALLLP